MRIFYFRLLLFFEEDYKANISGRYFLRFSYFGNDLDSERKVDF